MKPNDLASIRDVSVIGNFLPYIEREIEALTTAIDNKAYVAVAEGTLTPEKAVNYWIEKAAFRKLLQKFNLRVRVGQSVGTGTSELDK